MFKHPIGSEELKKGLISGIFYLNIQTASDPFLDYGSRSDENIEIRIWPFEIKSRIQTKHLMRIHKTRKPLIVVQLTLSSSFISQPKVGKNLKF